MRPKEIKLPTFAADGSSVQELRSREEIEPKYKWNLSDIYSSLQAWEEDFRFISENLNLFEQFEGRLSESAEVLCDCLKKDEEFGIKLGKLYLYSMLERDLNLANTEAQGRYDRVVSLHALVSEKTSFIVPEILEIPPEKLKAFIEEKSNKKLGINKYGIKTS